MSFDATCTCPRCHNVWYECADLGETYTCQKCGHREIEPEELDTFDFEDEEEELALMEWVKQVTSTKKKERSIES